MAHLTQFSKFKRTAIKSIAIAALAGSTLFVSCGDNVKYTTEEKVEYTKGIITEVEEVKPNRFKITDETTVEDKADSRIIATYLDGTKDTMTLAEAKLIDSNSNSETGRRRSGMSSVLMGGLMGYYMGRSSSVGPSSSAYKNNATYNKVNSGAGATMNSTARRTSVRRPVRSSGGGSSRSTRSMGG